MLISFLKQGTDEFPWPYFVAQIMHEYAFEIKQIQISPTLAQLHYK